MQFLFNPLKWLTDPAIEAIGGAIVNGLRHLFFIIGTFIYGLIIDLYDMFETLCYGRFLDSTAIEEFAKRIGLVLGVIMLFNVVFSFIKLLVDPDSNKGENSAVGVVKRVIIVIVMLGVSGFVFDTLYYIQSTVIRNNLIGKVLLPFSVDVGTNEETGNSNFGAILSEELFHAFYHIEEFDSNSEFSSDAADTIERCTSIESKFRNNIIKNHNFDIGNICLTEAVTATNDGQDFEKHIMYYNFLLSTLVGVAVAYLIFSYCISVGVRMVQLMFLEIISPMAIISYLSPKKDNMFSKWQKIYISTYIDVFIRIAIIGFVTFLISIVFSESTQDGFVLFKTINILNASSYAKFFYKVFLVLALLVFAKKVPDLLKELFPASASKLGLGGFKMKDMFGSNILTTGAKVATAGTAIGLLGAVASGHSRFKINRNNGRSVFQSALGAAGGALTALPRGLRAGAAKGNVFSNVSKGLNAQRGIDDKYDELVTGGGSTGGKIMAQFSSHFGETKGQTYSRIIRNSEAVSKSASAIDDLGDKISSVKIAKTNWENAKARGDSDATIKSLYDVYKREKKDRTNDVLSGHTSSWDIKDQSVAEEMKVHRADIASMIESGKVTLRDATGRTMGASDLISSDAIDTVSISASRTISETKMQPDYASAIQNDKAAGVNSNGKGK